MNLLAGGTVTKKVALVQVRKVRFNWGWVQPDEAATRVLALFEVPNSRSAEQAVNQFRVKCLSPTVAEQTIRACMGPDFDFRSFHQRLLASKKGGQLALQAAEHYGKPSSSASAFNNPLTVAEPNTLLMRFY